MTTLLSKNGIYSNAYFGITCLIQIIFPILKVQNHSQLAKDNRITELLAMSIFKNGLSPVYCKTLQNRGRFRCLFRLLTIAPIFLAAPSSKQQQVLDCDLFITSSSDDSRRIGSEPSIGRSAFRDEIQFSLQYYSYDILISQRTSRIPVYCTSFRRFLLERADPTTKQNHQCLAIMPQRLTGTLLVRNQ